MGDVERRFSKIDENRISRLIAEIFSLEIDELLTEIFVLIFGLLTELSTSHLTCLHPEMKKKCIIRISRTDFRFREKIKISCDTQVQVPK